MTDGTLRAGIIGSGQIGWRYDGGRWDGTRSVSHAACLDRHPHTRLVALLDTNAAALNDAASAIGSHLVTTTDLDRFLDQRLDVICIASPTASHADHVRAAAGSGARFVLIEKPVTELRSEFDDLMTFWATLPEPPRTFVNYFRRGLPQARLLRDACRGSGLVALDFNYSRGLAVNGVHLIDLCGYLLDLETMPGLLWVDPAGGSNPSFALRAKGVVVSFRGLDLPYHCIEARATLETGRMSLLEGGLRLEWEASLPNPAYPGFFRLGAAAPAMDPNLAARAFLDGTYTSLCALLDETTPSPSPLGSSAFAQEVLDAVLARVSP